MSKAAVTSAVDLESDRFFMNKMLLTAGSLASLYPFHRSKAVETFYVSAVPRE